jgi:hypothetical protein
MWTSRADSFGRVGCCTFSPYARGWEVASGSLVSNRCQTRPRSCRPVPLRQGFAGAIDGAATSTFRARSLLAPSTEGRDRLQLGRNASVWFAGGGGGRANDSGDPFVPSGRRWVRTSDPSSIRTIHDVVCRAPPGFVLVTLPAACAAVRHCWSRLLSASLSGARALLGISDDALVCRCIYEDTDRTVSQGSLSTTPTMRPLASADGPNPRGPIGS